MKYCHRIGGVVHCCFFIATNLFGTLCFPKPTTHSHTAGFSRLAPKAAHTLPFWLPQSVQAGTEIFPSPIPAAQVPLRIATIGKKLKKNFEVNQDLSVIIELCSLFPFWGRYMITRYKTQFISLLFHIHCPRKTRPKALC